MEVATAQRPASVKLLTAAGVGAAVAVALGVYGHVHDPSQRLRFTLFFSSTIAPEGGVPAPAGRLGAVHGGLGLGIFGRLPWRAPAWAGGAHRVTGRLAFLATLP